MKNTILSLFSIRWAIQCFKFNKYNNKTLKIIICHQLLTMLLCIYQTFNHAFVQVQYTPIWLQYTTAQVQYTPV